MKKIDLLIKNAEIVTFHHKTNQVIKEITNISISDKKITGLGVSQTQDAEKTIDAKGLTVLPGVIDSQVHFREPGLTHKEDLETGTRAAVLGGITSIFEMPNTNPNTTTIEAFNEKMNLAKHRAHCNYAFFIGASNENVEQLHHLELTQNSPGLKIFLGASFGTLLVDDDIIFEQIMKNGRRRLTIHSEDEARLKERKHFAIEAAHPRAHPLWRDEESALISTKKSIHLAEKYNRPVHILHISSSEEMSFLKEHKKISSVEILPQFLTLSAPECYERLGTLVQQNPPIRDKRHLEKLWQAVQDGTVDVIGSDHAPHTLEEKNKPYPQSPSGFPGVQTLLPIMLNHVQQNLLSIEKLTSLVTENPCRLFDVKNKGRIEVGYDADFTFVDLKKEMTITNKWIASKCGYTPFDGMKVKGWPTHTIIAGNTIMQNDEIILPHRGEAIEFSK
jgi:dihydroorotase